jgi:hypothetical protein
MRLLHPVPIGYSKIDAPTTELPERRNGDERTGASEQNPIMSRGILLLGFGESSAFEQTRVIVDHKISRGSRLISGEMDVLSREIERLVGPDRFIGW